MKDEIDAPLHYALSCSGGDHWMNRSDRLLRKAHFSRILFMSLLAVIVFLFLHWFVDFAQYNNEMNTEPDTDIEHYLTCEKDHWLTETHYLLFPDKTIVHNSLDVSYLHKHERSPTILFNDDIVTALQCTYTKETYSAEVKRLTSICSPEVDEEGNTVYILMYDPGEGVTAYARLSPETYGILYVTYQENVLINNWPELQLRTNQYQMPPLS